jgi:hypothetical protein
LFISIQLIVVPDAKMAEAAQDLENVAVRVVGMETDVNMVKVVAGALVEQLSEHAPFHR